MYAFNVRRVVAAVLLGGALISVSVAQAAEYPAPLHGVWMERGAAGRAACQQFRRDHDESKLSDAQIVTAERWTDVSEGERSHATLVSVKKTGSNAWRFVERFHLNGDAESSETQGRARLTARDAMLQTYSYQDEGATKTATRALRRCH